MKDECVYRTHTSRQAIARRLNIWNAEYLAYPEMLFRSKRTGPRHETKELAKKREKNLYKVYMCNKE